MYVPFTDHTTQYDLIDFVATQITECYRKHDEDRLSSIRAWLNTIPLDSYTELQGGFWPDALQIMVGQQIVEPSPFKDDSEFSERIGEAVFNWMEWSRSSWEREDDLHIFPPVPRWLWVFYEEVGGLRALAADPVPFTTSKTKEYDLVGFVESQIYEALHDHNKDRLISILNWINSNPEDSFAGFEKGTWPATLPAMIAQQIVENSPFEQISEFSDGLGMAVADWMEWTESWDPTDDQRIFPPVPHWFWEFFRSIRYLRGLVATAQREFGISSRSVLVSDHRHTGKGKAPIEFLNYRTVITLPLETQSVELWAKEDLHIEIRGVRHTLDATHKLKVTPNALSKIVVNIEACKDPKKPLLAVPALMLRTDFMNERDCFCIFPDVEPHKKMASIKDGEFRNNRAAVGIPDKPKDDPDHVSDVDCDHVQKAIGNLAKTVQHSYNEMGGGICHDRFCMPANMSHEHWQLHFGKQGRKAVYQPLREDEVREINKNSKPLTDSIALGLGDWFEDKIDSVQHIVVHTVTKVGGDIVDTAENTLNTAVDTTVSFGEDLVHGDLRGMGTDLVTGLRHEGGNLLRGGENLGVDLAKGAKQMLVVTIHTLEDVVHFAVEHTGIIGKLIGFILAKVKAALDKFVDWLKSLLGWDDIVHTQKYLKNVFDDALDQMPAKIPDLKAEVDGFFDSLRADVDNSLDSVINRFAGKQKYDQTAHKEKHSDAIEKLEWLISKVVEGDNSVPSAFTAATAHSSSPLADISRQLDPSTNKEVEQWLNQTLSDLEDMFKHPSRAPETLVHLVLNAVKEIIDIFLETARDMADLALDVAGNMIEYLKSFLDAEIYIPFVTELFHFLFGEDTAFSLSNLLTMILAIPTTIICKALYGRRPFDSAGNVTLALLSERDWAILNFVVSIVDGLFCFAAEQPRPESIEGDLGDGAANAVDQVFHDLTVKLFERGLVVLAVYSQIAQIVEEDGKPSGAWVFQWSFPIVDLIFLHDGGGHIARLARPAGPILGAVMAAMHIALTALDEKNAKTALRHAGDYLAATRGFYEVGLLWEENPETVEAVATADLVIQILSGAINFALVSADAGEAD